MTLDDIRAKVKASAASGELLTAIDLAQQGAALAKDASDITQFQIDEVILLARAASYAEAKDKFDNYGLAEGDGHKARSLKARLAKDLGFAAVGEDRIAHLKASRDLYQKVCDELDPDWDRTDYEYNAINVVTLSALTGQIDQATAYIDRLTGFTPLQTYYSWATKAELLIAIKAKATDIKNALSAALACDDAGEDARITTLTQLARLAPEHPALDLLKPRPFLHYAGHMIAAPGASEGRILAQHHDILKSRITAAMENITPSATFGSLASGADILIVETALAMGAQAQIFLPFDASEFHRTSIAPAGADWAIRARGCLDHPNSQVIRMTRAKMEPDNGEVFAACSRRAMGAAILTAERRLGDARQLIIWDGINTGGVAGADADRREWVKAFGADADSQTIISVGDLSGSRPANRLATPVITPRKMAALVFGDAKNFSKLREDQLPVFVDKVMGAVAETLEPLKDHLLFANTWGDGVFAVFKTATTAAEFALMLQDRMETMRNDMRRPDYTGQTLPADLKVRLGMHFGVVFEKVDPVTGATNFFGEAVARAARIEPITKEGRIFVSEEFASELALDPATDIRADYVGEKEAAKNYGRFRLYRIRR